MGLELTQNALGDDGAVVVALLARRLPRLAQLCLGKNRIGQRGALPLLQVTAERRAPGADAGWWRWLLQMLPFLSPASASASSSASS